MNYILVDTDPGVFYPLTLTRPVSELRAGILTLKEKWEKRMKGISFSYMTSPYLSGKYPTVIANDNILIDSTVLADKTLSSRLPGMPHNQAWVKDNKCIAIRVDATQLQGVSYPFRLDELISSTTQVLSYHEEFRSLQKLTDLFTQNENLLAEDFKYLTKGLKSDKVNSTNTVLGDQLFVKKGAKVRCSIINTETGPVYIDKDAEVMEGSMLRGPLYIGKGAVIKMGAKIYGATTIGPECRVGGEVSNSVLQGYSNKGHDGFLGNSILGEWCNLGADTNTSNLKNNYGPVKIWDFKTSSYKDSGLQFCGLLMGDHSKSAINTQFNTGTTVGVMANIFKSSFPDKYIPSFSWIGDHKSEKFDFERSIALAREVMKRRHVEIDQEEIGILKYLSGNG